MLSSVLNSQLAIHINIQIMRAFVRMKDIVADNTDLRKSIEHIERRLDVHDQQIKIAFAALKSILQPEPDQILKALGGGTAQAVPPGQSLRARKAGLRGLWHTPSSGRGRRCLPEGKRSPPPATPSFRVENTGKEGKKDRFDLFC